MSQSGPKEKTKTLRKGQLGGGSDSLDRAGERRGKGGEHPLFVVGGGEGDRRRGAGCDRGQRWALEAPAVAMEAPAEAVEAEGGVLMVVEDGVLVVESGEALLAGA